jgi:myo-inositol-1(or 4)-monophosphatase
MALSDYETNIPLREYMDLALTVAQKARDVSIKYLKDAGILKQDGKDIKTDADLAINALIVAELAKTGLPILSEETGCNTNEEGNLYWIVDPLDGTMNFTRGFPFYSVSIGMMSCNRPILGVVIDINRNKVYSAADGLGAFLDSKNISVSHTSQIRDAILCTGFPSGSNFGSSELSRIIDSIKLFKKVRMLGAASLMLTSIAEGVFDVYYENDIYLWDVAPALCIIKEAGGYVYIIRNNGYKYEVLACNMGLSELAQEILLTKKK